MLGSFVKNLLGVKAEQTVQAGLGLYAKIDPKGMSEADLRTMEEALDRLGVEVADAQQVYDKEKREADAINALLHQRMAAAEALQAQVNEATDPGRRAKLEASLTILVKMLEDMAPEIEREEREAKDAGEFLVGLQQQYQEMGVELRGARAALETAQREMRSAEMARGRAERQAESARVAAGLSQRMDGMSVALRAMREQAATDNAAAAASTMKAKMLRPSKPEQDDPDIAAALAAASGAAPAPNGLAERLAAIKAKAAA